MSRGIPIDPPAYCPFSGKDVATFREPGSGIDAVVLDSPSILGPAKLAGSLLATIQNRSPEELRGFRRWVVEQRLAGTLPDMLTTYHFDKHHSHRPLKLGEKAEQLFQWFIRESGDQPLGYINLDARDSNALYRYVAACSASDAQNDDELELTLKVLERRGWIDRLPGMNDVQVTPEGWLAVEEAESTPAAEQAFIAMSFNENLRPAREAIETAIRNAGYRSVIIDQVDYLGPVMDRLLTEIRRSRFLVADYTCDSIEDGDRQRHFLARGGVYYEAGFAHGLDVPVISTVRADLLAHKDAVHFDVAQYNHIAWDDVEDLRTRLSNRITAVIGWGPLSQRDDDST